MWAGNLECNIGGLINGTNRTKAVQYEILQENVEKDTRIFFLILLKIFFARFIIVQFNLYMKQRTNLELCCV